MSEVKRGRGRPKKYVGELLVYILSLYTAGWGSTDIRNILNAPAPRRDRKPSTWYILRNKKIAPDPVGITPPSLVSIVKENKITLPKGRPTKEKAEAKEAKVTRAVKKAA